MKNRTACGMRSPTNPIIPPIVTETAVMRDAATKNMNLSFDGENPRLCANSSPRARAFSALDP